ncbi:hypothetical protein GMD78_13010 [Ornithinibacillus sp. L9]|uniref:Uncharacterized protein n=1 Tax=Ornithinibacillus caprae TaxID=2678566 RepID=A0A6N8FI01_9BACI|nr:hypothetical protein [Ornithinibacillus caprae]MUK89292.1 hypothetical protein [Ornithinibacillus caprae]
MKYFEEAKNIWINEVPKSGQADTVEGELIRAIERLRYEAQNNGNGNWDDGFERFCQYLWGILNDQKTFDNNVINEIKIDIDTLLNFEQPYLDDDLYDRITDHIIEWSFVHKGPVKREKDPNQYR